jgi:NitT/TauT family transport system permease protein
MTGCASLPHLRVGAAGRLLLNPLYAPSPSQVGAALIDLFSDCRIWPHLEATFSAALGGLALGIVVGVLLGIVAALVPFIAELLEPVMAVLNAIPRVILAPLFVIWLGIGLASKVALSFILVAVLIFFTVFTGIRQVDRRLVERVVTLGGDRWALVRHVYLPSVASWVLGNLKIAVGFAFTGACVGEFVPSWPDLGERWLSRLVATAEENCLSPTSVRHGSAPSLVRPIVQ